MTCERANAATYTAVSPTATSTLRRRAQATQHHTRATSSTTPPRARTPVSSATRNPTTSDPPATGQVGTSRHSARAPGLVIASA